MQNLKFKKPNSILFSNFGSVKMDYIQTLAYLFTRLPMFTRVGASAYKADLNNTLALCALVNNPQNKFKSVHIAGTNGKGSTSHMLAAILQTAGYKTGLYTSPHLKDFRERIRINGEMISEQAVIDFVARHQTGFENINPSFFEMTVALAFDYFAKEQVDIVVIEVGLGGRLDSTNVITPLLSVITNIGWDHMNLLGETLQLIAGEKAGIIKPKVPVIIGEKQPEVEAIFIDKAKKENSKIVFASEEWEAELSIVNSLPIAIGRSMEFLDLTVTKTQHPPLTAHHSLFTTHHSPLAAHHLQLDLPGTYQLKNVKTVLTAVDELRLQGFVITDEHVKTALGQVKTMTGLHGRWEIISIGMPLTIVDTGHNVDGIQEVLKNIARVPYRILHFVIGMVNDKDSSKVLALLPKNAIYYFCKPDIPRGLDAESLKQQAEDFGLQGEVYPSVKAGLSAAQQSAEENDLVFVGGSTFVVAEVV